MKTRLEGEEQRQGHGALAGRPFANLGKSSPWLGLEGKQMSGPRVYLTVGGVCSSGARVKYEGVR